MPRELIDIPLADGSTKTILAPVPEAGLPPSWWARFTQTAAARPTPVADLTPLATKVTLSTETSARQQGDAALDTRLSALETKTASLAADLGGLKVTVASQATLLETVKKLLGIK